MKTQTNQTQSAADIVRAAIENAPARLALAEAQKESAAIHAKRQEVAAELARLEKEQHGGNTAKTVKDILANREVEADYPQRIFLQRQKLEVLDAATREYHQKIATLKRDLAQQVNAALRPVRQAFVARMSAALRELRAAYEDDQATITAALAEAGIEATTVAFLPVSEVVALDRIWLDARRAEGYTV